MMEKGQTGGIVYVGLTGLYFNFPETSALLMALHPVFNAGSLSIYHCVKGPYTFGMYTD